VGLSSLTAATISWLERASPPLVRYNLRVPRAPTWL